MRQDLLAMVQVLNSRGEINDHLVNQSIEDETKGEDLDSATFFFHSVKLKLKH